MRSIKKTSQKRLGEIAVAYLRHYVTTGKMPKIESKEMNDRFTSTMEIPELKKINITRNEARDFVLHVLTL